MQETKRERVAVITGSTRGIGRGLAEAFLDEGTKVGICGRTAEGVEAAVAEMGERAGPDRVWGMACDVRQRDQLQNLWESAVARFGRVDIWVNNAGVGLPQGSIWEGDLEACRATIETNLWGTVLGSVVAVRGMLEQGGGSIFNMEGLGSDGRMVDGLAIYGTTKYGLDYFNRALIEETRDTAVHVGTLSPGMVVTDMTDVRYPEGSAEGKRFRRVMNLIGDRVENVTPWLANQMLSHKEHGARIKYLTFGRMLRRMVAAPFRQRDVFREAPPGG
jgi:NAD(P)-dependent dehydrogenase (short-subunit alcohol dehydrogenase family)